MMQWLGTYLGNQSHRIKILRELVTLFPSSATFEFCLAASIVNPITYYIQAIMPIKATVRGLDECGASQVGSWLRTTVAIRSFLNGKKTMASILQLFLKSTGYQLRASKVQIDIGLQKVYELATRHSYKAPTHISMEADQPCCSAKPV
jgi:hypothetical protein